MTMWLPAILKIEHGKLGRFTIIFDANKRGLNNFVFMKLLTTNKKKAIQ